MGDVLMKKIFILSMSLLILGISSVCSAGMMEDPIAVLPVGIKAEISRSISRAETERISGILRDEMEDSGVFYNWVEREDVIRAFDEQRFQMSGMVDPSTAVSIGKMIGAKYIVIGNVTGLTREGGTVYSHVSVKIVEVETGRVSVGGRGDGKKSGGDAVYRSIEQAAMDAINGEKGIMVKLGFGKRR